MGDRLMENRTSMKSEPVHQELVNLEQNLANLSSVDELKGLLIKVTALQRQVFQELDRRKLANA